VHALIVTVVNGQHLQLRAMSTVLQKAHIQLCIQNLNLLNFGMDLGVSVVRTPDDQKEMVPAI
jgi:hypothetical protein